MPKPNSQNKDFPQVLKESYDPALERIRVDALITDGIDAMVVNPDGSINVNVVSGTTADYNSYFNEVTSVAAATLTTILTYIVPLATTANLQKVEVSGTNIAAYTVVINTVTQNKLYTYFNNLNSAFDFMGNGQSGYPLVAGDTVQIKVIHNRPDLGDFNSRLQVVEV